MLEPVEGMLRARPDDPAAVRAAAQVLRLLKVAEVAIVRVTRFVVDLSPLGVLAIMARSTFRLGW
mgnify:CR=1 FL=1